jgi:hypothetical protein
MAEIPANSGDKKKLAFAEKRPTEGGEMLHDGLGPQDS